MVFDTVYLPRRICRMLGLRYVELLRRVFLPLLVPTVLLASVLGLGRMLVSDGPAVVAVSAVGAAVFVAAWWLTPTARIVRNQVRARRDDPGVPDATAPDTAPALVER